MGIIPEPHSMPQVGPRGVWGVTLVRREEVGWGWGYKEGLHTRWHLNYTKKDRTGILDLDKE